MHKIKKPPILKTDVPEILNAMIVSVRKGGRVGFIAIYAGLANDVNRGALMDSEKRVRLIGTGQAPVYQWWKEILHAYTTTGKFDPTL